MHHMTRARLAREAEAAADSFNARYPIGVSIRFWPGFKEGPGRKSRTRSTAWLMGGHTPVVAVEDYPGGIALTHVEVRLPAAAAAGQNKS